MMIYTEKKNETEKRGQKVFQWNSSNREDKIVGEFRDVRGWDQGEYLYLDYFYKP